MLLELSAEEMREFEMLDMLPPLDGDGLHIAWAGDAKPKTTREQR